MEYNHVDHGAALTDHTLLNSFIELHRTQLELSGVPRYFYPIIFQKLQNQVNSSKNHSKKSKMFVRSFVKLDL